MSSESTQLKNNILQFQNISNRVNYQDSEDSG